MPKEKPLFKTEDGSMTPKELAQKLRGARDPLGPFGPFAYYRIDVIDEVIKELEAHE